MKQRVPVAKLGALAFSLVLAGGYVFYRAADPTSGSAPPASQPTTMPGVNAPPPLDPSPVLLPGSKAGVLAPPLIPTGAEPPPAPPQVREGTQYPTPQSNVPLPTTVQPATLPATMP